MILRFLRLFSVFRALEQDRDVIVANLRESLQEQNTQNLLLQDRIDAVMSDRAKLWDMMQTAVANERATLQMQVNFTTQQKFGVTPFPDAAHLPPSMEASDQGTAPFTRRRTPSEMIAHGTTQFIKQYAERHKPTATGPVSA